MVFLRSLEAAALCALFVVIPVQSRLAPSVIKRGVATYMGCYNSSKGLTFDDTYPYQSSGYCHDQCATGQLKAVMGMISGSDCWCGDSMPPLSTKVSDSYCNVPCNGWQADNCGGASNYFAIWNSGLVPAVTNLPDGAATTSGTPSGSSTTSSTPSVVTLEGQTVVVTASGASTSDSSSSSGSGPNKAGIAAGVVVGIIAIGAAAGGIFLYIRAQRRKEVEDEYKRQAAISSFVAGGKPGSSAGASHDTRLDPVIMTQRRMSDGSIADNQDYSRRILKVTNA